MSKIIINSDVDTLAQQAAETIATAIGSVLKGKDTAVLGVPGGRSVGIIFSHLLTQQDIDWSRVHIFIVDERLRGLDDPESNYYLVTRELITPLLQKGLRTEAVHPFKYMPDTEDKGTLSYQQELLTVGGKYDILLVSAGEDGHIAGLYPSHESIKSSKPYFTTFYNSPKPPLERMSSTRSLLSRSTWGLVVFFGESKAQAYKNYIDPSLSVTECPAKIIDSCTHGHVLTTHG